MGILMKNGVPYASGSEIPEGGTRGQVLAKASDISGDFEWANGGGTGGGNANFDIGTVPLGGAGVYEVNAILNNNDSERVRATYSRGVNGELPDWFTMSVTSGLGTDDFEVSTRGYTEQKAAQAQNNAQTYADLKLTQKQDKLVSGTNIKTVNGNSLLGDGNIEIGGGGGTVDTAMSDTSENAVQNKVIKTYVDNIQGLPGGGTNGQILARNSMSPENAEWIDNPVGTHFEVGAEKWYGTYTAGGVTYQVYSKLLDIGALPSAAGAAQYPHGITGINQILQISGFTDDGFVMNAPRQNAQDNISIYQAQKSGNIVIEVGKDRSSKTGFVMLIYAKNN